MNAAWRAKAMLTDPSAEWPRIEQESGDAAHLLSRYVALLALVPAVFGFIGASVIGAIVPGIGSVRLSFADGLVGAVFGYMMTCAIVLVLGFLINVLAPFFDGQRNFDNALKLAVYSYTPVWLAGIFLVLPGLRFLGLASFYGAYVLWVGLPRLMKSSEQKSPSYATLIVACAWAFTVLAAAVQRKLFGLPGL